MTIEKLKAAVYDRMVLIEQHQDRIRQLTSEIKSLNEQIKASVEAAQEKLSESSEEKKSERA